MQDVQLSELEAEMLAGGQGEAKKRAMKLLLRYARIVGANFFVPITSAHIDGCLYHGQSSLDFVDSMLSLGGSVCVPTTLNVGAVDVVHPQLNRGDPGIIDKQRELTQAYTAMGCTPSLTCAPYQRKKRPSLGQNIAWAESNAIVFANSVLGARTERYGDFLDLCAALTGRVPLVGLHCDENRLASIVVDVEDFRSTDLSRDIFFGCVGYCLGKLVGSRVAALTGLPRDTSEDELKALGAAAASSGAVALFHVVGVTPEAPTLLHTLANPSNISEDFHITVKDLHAAKEKLCPIRSGDPLAAVCLGTPHFSLTEFRNLAILIADKRTAVEFYVSTSREIAEQIQEESWYSNLTNFGVQIVVDTCTYLAPVVKDSEGVILTNSIKWAHYGPGNLKRRAGLVSMEACVRSATIGRVSK